jgi:hypothetical protein
VHDLSPRYTNMTIALQCAQTTIQLLAPTMFLCPCSASITPGLMSIFCR